MEGRRRGNVGSDLSVARTRRWFPKESPPSEIQGVKKRVRELAFGNGLLTRFPNRCIALSRKGSVLDTLFATPQKPIKARF